MENREYELSLKYFEVLWKKKNTIFLSLFIYVGFISLSLLIMDVITPLYLTINNEVFDFNDFNSNVIKEVMICSIPAFYLIVRYFIVRHKCNKIHNELIKNNV